MILLFIIGLVLTAIAVTLIARAFMVSRIRTTTALGSIGHYGFAGSIELQSEGGFKGFVDDVATKIGDFLLETLHLGDENSLRKTLVSAGMYDTTPRTIMGYQLLAAVSVPALWIWFSLATGFSTAVVVLGVIAALVIGWMAPTSYVRHRAETRLYQIDYDMPELIDLLVVMVEAGLTLTAAMQNASNRLTGPLGEELRIAMQEQRMGLPLLQTLENMLSRCPTPAMQSFVRAMVQGERLGVSVGQILRSLALEMRKRRRAMAEEKAQKAPIKILFPLVFMIFPAMFLVLLGPALFAIFDALKGK
jgi:tight adherence protein C